MREKRGITLISVIVIILAVITAILVTVEIIVIIKDKSNDEKTNAIQMDIKEWIGIYENEENTGIMISRIGIDKLEILVYCDDENLVNNYSWFFADVDTDTNKIKVRNKKYDDEEYNAVITYTDNGINIEPSSTNELDLLNSVKGFYGKKKFERLGWDGVYTNEKITIIISEVDEEDVHINILREFSDNRTFYADKCSKKMIEYYDTEYEEEILIEKAENGITVQASSEADEYSLLNKISGEYVRQD